MFRLLSLIAAVALATPALADTASELKNKGLTYDENILTSCLKGKTSREDRETCIAIASTACTQSAEGGDSTAGMVSCLAAESETWDKMLNGTYEKLLAEQKVADADPDQNPGGATPIRVSSLVEMQRSWVKYREAHCALAAAQWDGGTGGNIEANGCWLDDTARQTLVLQSFLKQE